MRGRMNTGTDTGSLPSFLPYNMLTNISEFDRLRDSGAWLFGHALFMPEIPLEFWSLQNVVKTMKQTCRTGVSWSFCLLMESGRRGMAEQRIYRSSNSPAKKCQEVF